MPEKLEDQLAIYVAYRAELGDQPGTVSSYLSGIKRMLLQDGVEINTRTTKLRAMIKACKYKNRQVRNRFPISEHLLGKVIKNIRNIFHDQPYLSKLYSCIVVLGFYGMMRVGELAKGTHPILARDVHFNHKERKVQIILRSSKTHSQGDKPQYIKISTEDSKLVLNNQHLCPYKVIWDYLEMRGPKLSDVDTFLVFRDNSPVKPHQVQAVLKKALLSLCDNPKEFSFHSLRSGFATELEKRHVSLRVIQIKGRWKTDSNVVFRYLENWK